MIVSIVVPVRREARAIERFLDSLAAQDLAGLEWEVIVADGMSDDGTREILARRPGLKVIDNPGLTVSRGLNAAIRAARGDIILRMDAHSEYAPDYVRQCLALLEETGADNVGGPALTRASSWIQRAIAAAYHSPLASGGAKFHNPAYEGPADTVPYGCWRRATLERLGLFDESLARNQDDELNLRLRLTGGRIWQSPRIRSWYWPRATLRALFRQYFEYGYWKVAVMRKHRRPPSWRSLAPAAFLLLAVASVFIHPLLWLLALYPAASLIASVQAAHRHGWSLFPALPAVFATYHVAYGFGFLCGVLSVFIRVHLWL
ncbi:MAG TPA: glycosyltransferase family 2 protein [Bryobacteraceae bacterium]|nr:glycosyltransferase family 2 protein [Bryobacteraceae bacterium]